MAFSNPIEKCSRYSGTMEQGWGKIQATFAIAEIPL
jgi:hypothetical protein